MKLLFFIGAMKGGGAERVMSVLCNHLARRGHEIYLVTDTDIPMAYSLDEKVNIYSRQIKRTKSKIVNAYRYQKKARQIVVNTSPDVVISFMWELNAIVLTATLGLKVPVIVSEHTTFNKSMSFYEWFVRFQLNKLAKKVTILTQSDFDFLGTRLPNKVVMHNPLSFKVNAKNTFRTKSLLAVGSIDRWQIKGFDTLIEVWRGISKQYPEWVLKIAGGGTDANLNYLKSLAEKSGCEQSIQFLGFTTDIDKVMQTSSVFVLSSRYEGLPMVLMEAMSQGCACVAFNCPFGPREILRHNENGLLVADQNVAEMREKFSVLIESEQKRTTIANEGRKSVSKFDAQMIAQKWEALFEEVVE